MSDTWHLEELESVVVDLILLRFIMESYVVDVLDDLPGNWGSLRNHASLVGSKRHSVTLKYDRSLVWFME